MVTGRLKIRDTGSWYYAGMGKEVDFGLLPSGDNSSIDTGLVIWERLKSLIDHRLSALATNLVALGFGG